MEKIGCNFCRTESVDLQLWENIIGKLRLDFVLLCRGDVDAHNALSYVNDLCRNAKPLEKDPRMSFFGMADPTSMPSDARVDFFYRPSYYATAFMVKAIVLYPEILYGEPWYDNELDKDELRKIVSSCLLGCTGRGFNGHGIDCVCGLVETMEIFADADMSSFVMLYPDLCPEFTSLYKQTLDYITIRVSENNLAGPWGDNYTERGKAILRKNGITVS